MEKTTMTNRPNITATERLNRRLGSALSLILIVISALVPAYAHGGFDHIQGNVAKVANNVLTVKTTRGEVDIKVDNQTELTVRGQKAQLADLQVGARVIADLPKGSKTAHSVKIGVVSNTVPLHSHRSTAK